MAPSFNSVFMTTDAPALTHASHGISYCSPRAYGETNKIKNHSQCVNKKLFKIHYECIQNAYPAEGVLPCPSDGADGGADVRLDGRPVHLHGLRAEHVGDSHLEHGVFRELVVQENADNFFSGCGGRKQSVHELKTKNNRTT